MSDTLAPTADVRSNFAALAEANYDIDLYIAALEFLPTSIPLADGRDLLSVWQVGPQIIQAQTHTNVYIDDVGNKLRGLRDRMIPNCNSAFASFASVVATIPEIQQGTPIGIVSRNKLIPALNAYDQPVRALQTQLSSMNSGFTQFHTYLLGDMSVLDNLKSLFDPSDPTGIVRRLNLSAADVSAAQQAISTNSPTFQQDIGVAEDKAGDMLNVLSLVTNAFAVLGSKIDTLVNDLTRAENPSTPPLLETIVVQKSLQDWKQFTDFVSKIGF